MGEMRDVLAGAADRVSMTEPAIERLKQRRDRRRRHERSAAAALGLMVGAIVIAVPLWVSSDDPASEALTGPTSGSSPGPMGWLGVAATVALWLAVGVLGTAMFAAGRDGVLAVRRNRREGAQDMPSGTTREALPQAAEMRGIQIDGERQRRANRWLLVAVVVLAVALAGLAVTTIVGGSESSDVDPAVIDAIDGMHAAINDGDAQAAASWYADPAVLTTFDGYRAEGIEEIEAYMEGVISIDVVADRGDVIGSGPVGAALVTYESTAGPGRFIMIVRTGQDGKILYAEQIKAFTWPA